MSILLLRSILPSRAANRLFPHTHSNPSQLRALATCLKMVALRTCSFMAVVLALSSIPISAATDAQAHVEPITHMTEFTTAAAVIAPRSPQLIWPGMYERLQPRTSTRVRSESNITLTATAATTATDQFLAPTHRLMRRATLEADIWPPWDLIMTYTLSLIHI